MSSTAQFSLSYVPALRSLSSVYILQGALKALQESLGGFALPKRLRDFKHNYYGKIGVFEFLDIADPFILKSWCPVLK